MRIAKKYGRLFVLAIFVMALLGLPFSNRASAAPVLPDGYTLTPVANGRNFPTNLAWLPDGTMLISEKAGIVKAHKNGVTQTQPFIDISSTTNDYWDRGLLGIAVDPAYDTNHYVYLMRTFENNAADYTGTKMGQLVRVTINPSSNQMIAGSLVVLVGKDVAASCNDLAVTADCIPADSPSHGVGDVLFAADGTLFVTSGDGSSFTETDPQALRAQNLDSLAGKLLHIDRNGKAVPGNPYHNGNADANRSKVWAMGLRNPWRLTIKPGTTMPYLVDVGWGDWEEVNVATSGANFGWPCYEGSGQHPTYGELTGCQQLYTKVSNGQATVKPPLTAWNHTGYSGAAVGGAFVTGSSYPASLQGSYMFGDYANEFMRTLRTNGSHGLSQGPDDFMEGFTGLVDIEQGPDGFIYVVSIIDETFGPNTGTVYRLDYGTVIPPDPPTPPGNCNANEYRAEYFNNKTMNGTAALTRCEVSPLNHDWALGGPGTGVNADNFSARYTGNFNFTGGNHKFEAWADDGVRIFVDGQLVLNGWVDQAYTHYQNTVAVTAGAHAVTVEFYDAFEDAAVRAEWTLVDPTPPTPPSGCDAGQFKAEYFNSLTPGGAAALTRCEAAPINHDWALGSPGAGVNDEVFSSRWSGNFTFQSGQYRFNALADDGVRIYVDGALVLNGWFDQPATAYETTANLTAGTHAVVVEYYDKLEDAILQASWSQVGGNTAPQASITTPAAISTAVIGSTVTFSGSATDAEDGAVPAASLSWNAVVRHCGADSCHSHPLQQFTGASGSFVYPDHGADAYHIELSLVATDSAGAQSTVKTVRIDPVRVPAECPADWYVAEYFNNTTLAGTPVATGCVQTVNFDWVFASPLAGVNNDFFSARFSATKAFEAGNYRFSTTGDDGVRLFVDGTALIDAWVDQPATTYTADRAMTVGPHNIRLEFYDATEDAVAQLTWIKL